MIPRGTRWAKNTTGAAEKGPRPWATPEATRRLLRRQAAALPSRSHREQDHPAGQRQAAQDRRERDRLLLLGGRRDRNKKKDLLPGGVGDPLVGEGDHPDGDQHDGDDEHSALHAMSSLRSGQ